jgi:anti-sigma regulatory factor (Ser/Thr protein kinase)
MHAATPAEVRWVCLPPDPESSARCRRFLRSAFGHWGLDEGLDDAQLLVSELCSNVIRHAGTTMVVTARWAPDERLVRVSVHDGSARMPSVQAPSDVSSSGRGLRIVSGVARRWGSHPSALGKTVWFELGVGVPRPVPADAF